MKYDIKKLRDNFEVEILWSESEEFFGKENIKYTTSHEIEVLEYKLKRISSEIYAQDKGYHKTKYVLKLFGEVFYEGRADLGDYDDAGIAKHIDKYLTFIFDFEGEDYTALNKLVKYLFNEIDTLSNEEVELVLDKDELLKIS